MVENPLSAAPPEDSSSGKSHKRQTVAPALTRKLSAAMRPITFFPILPIMVISPMLKMPQQIARKIIGEEMVRSRFRISVKSGSVTARTPACALAGSRRCSSPRTTADTMASRSFCICPSFRFLGGSTVRQFSPF